MNLEGQQGPGQLPRQPLPIAQSVLWRPSVQELAPPDGDTSPIFLSQRALAAVEEHLRTATRQTLFGFLVGQVFEAPETGNPYVVVHGAVRVPQMILNGATEAVVAQSLAPVQRMLQPEDGVVVGWYRSEPGGVPRITVHDHQAHVGHFHRSWQIALIVCVRPAPSALRAGVFRPMGEVGSPVPYLSFYELLDAENYRDGFKRPHVAWSDYWSPDPALWRMRTQPPPPETLTPLPRAPRVTPSERPSGGRRLTPLLVPPEDRDYDVAWRPRGYGTWLSWVIAGLAVSGAVALGIQLGLRPETGGKVSPVEAVTPPAAASPESLAAHGVALALDAYRERASLFASRRMTCVELAQGLADVDDRWLDYTLVAPRADVPEDTTLAAQVEAVESDFERSGCPRP